MMTEMVPQYRQRIKDGLAQLNKDCHRVFRLMYSPKDPDLQIDQVVEQVPEDRLEWALTQVNNTLKELGMNTI